MIEKLEQDPGLSENICFTDECSFFLREHVNYIIVAIRIIKICIVREDYTQYPQKIYVSAFILKDKIVGDVFLNQILTCDIFVDLLEITSHNKMKVY